MIATLVGVILLAMHATSSHPAVAVVAAPPVSAPRFTIASAPVIPEKVGVGAGDAEELGPIITAESAAVLDATSGVVLFGKRPYAVRPIASITKLLTALAVVRDGPDWDALVAVIPSDIPPEGHTILRPGDRVTIRDLLTAMLVRSDNGAARALIRGHEVLEGRFLADAVPRIIRALGLSTIRVVDPAGLDPRNVGSAVDIARLMRAALKEPIVRERTILSRATIAIGRPSRGRLTVRATNILLHDAPPRTFRVVGGKTGYLDESGFNLAIGAERGGHEVVVVVLGSATHEDRFRDARMLADWTFRNYRWSDANDAN